jgi:hypothetical protein
VLKAARAVPLHCCHRRDAWKVAWKVVLKGVPIRNCHPMGVWRAAWKDVLPQSRCLRDA